jgi:hypothetical protein
MVFVLGLYFFKVKNSCPLLPSLPEKECGLFGNADNPH